MGKAYDLQLIALVSVLATSAVALNPASAQTQTPQRTTATYQDWTVRCEVKGTAKTCEMAQAMQIQGQSQPVTQVAIGQQSKTAPLKIVFQVPINVWLPVGVKLVINDKDQGIVANYGRCVPGACFADADIKDDQIKKLKGAAENGKLQFQDAAQQVVSIPVSFKGFDQAYDAMQKP